MKYKLYLAEKPSLGKKLAAVLGQGQPHKGYIEGSGWIVTWCVGHLYRLCNPDEYDKQYSDWNRLDLLPIIPSPWRVVADEKKRDQIKIINKLVKNASSVINVGDADKEGQYLVDLVIRKSGYTGDVYRLWPVDPTPEGLIRSHKAIKPNHEYRGHSLAAEYRGRADWLVGLNLTRLYTCTARKSGYRLAVSLGRVQSPTLSLIVQRFRDIQNFKVTKHYGLRVKFKSKNIEYQSDWVIPDALKNEAGYLLTMDPVYSVIQDIKGQTGVITEATHKVGKQSAPLPYSTSKLQAEACSRFGYNLKKSAQILQSLYDKEHITYPRTDVQYLCEEVFSTSRNVMTLLRKKNVIQTDDWDIDPSVMPSCFNNKKTTAHEGIIPTGKVPEMSSLSEEELKVYQMLATRYAMQFMPDMEYISSNVITCVANHHFKTTANVTTLAGWKAIYNEEGNKEDGQESLDTIIQGNVTRLVLNDPSLVLESKPRPIDTKPPRYFTEGTLVLAMASISAFVPDPAIRKVLNDSNGIGTDATRTSIIERLKTVEYIKVNKKGHITPTSVGETVYDALPVDLQNPSLTALWEAMLKKIANNELAPEVFLQQQITWLNLSLDKLKVTPPSLSLVAPSLYTCHQCARPVNRIKGKKGFFWSCTGYPDDCKVTYPDVKGKPVLPIKGDGDICPECNKGHLVTRMAKNTKKGAKPFLGCSEFPSCKHSIWDKSA